MFPSLEVTRVKRLLTPQSRAWREDLHLKKIAKIIRARRQRVKAH